MSKTLQTIFLAGLICFLVLLAACKKSETAEISDILDFTDDTTAAAELVTQANADLNKIKIMYRKNEDQLEELKTAMSNQDVEKVKKISDDLVYILNDGMKLGEDAIEKIEKAEAMKINPDFKEYLRLKQESLRKQLDAFESRRQIARLLRDGFGANDPKLIERGKLEFKEKEENFQKTMEAAREISKKANQFAKESSKK